MVKNLPGMQVTWVQSLGWEDPLEKEMATHSSILPWKIPWTEELGRATVHGVTKSRTRLSDFTHSYVIKRLPRWYSGKEFACQRGRRRFDPWAGKIPWSRK